MFTRQNAKLGGLLVGWLVLILLMVPVWAKEKAKTSNPVEVSSKKIIRTMEVNVGQQFVVELESNPSTGYQWQFADALDIRLLKALSDKNRFEAPLGAQRDTGGKDLWFFKAVGKGKTVIHLKYAKSQKGEVRPAKLVDIMVTIK
jgi:predicted secreted protein